MPPRFAYWTLLIDNGPTAFRARDAADLLPTLHQLKRKNPNVVLKWFSGGRLWDSPEAASEARRRRPPQAVEKRGPAWRPGGKHADPRDRFRKKKDGPSAERAARPFSSSRRPPPRRSGPPKGRGGPRRTK
jgi:hypothetical protein